MSAFPDHTLDSAPAAARAAMAATARHRGYVPAPVGRLATSPELLGGFLKLSGIFETTTLAPVEREVVVMTVAARNECHVCVAMHSEILAAKEAPSALIEALRAQERLPDARLDGLRVFTLAVMDSAGAVPEETLQAFLAHGFTARNALEVVLGVGTYTLSTFANRLTDAPLDEALAPFAWHAA
ncbi:carboxymuconolactone decarboxylase family protein [Amycolatopsis sp. NPDC059027]|uniref:carboxymuconolactone decarboxylase family protein n=1 Tax=Amycolatopsis sp. NPDC059027 TaxID=3346709 RepID=UPI0036728CF3